MNKYKKIEDMFKSWGKNKEELPGNNEVLKREILSKIPINFSEKVFIKHSPFIWVPFTFSALAVLILLINITGFSKSTIRQNDVQTGSMPQIETLQNYDYSKSIMPTMPYYGGEEVSITDKREFLKVNYNATLRTRDVTDLTNRVEMIVRSMGGRVDSSNSGDKNGYVNFVIAKDNLESFKIAVKDLVKVRFYNEQINSQNLLPQKQMIEENQRQAEKTLNELQIERGQVVKNHNQKVSSYQTLIGSKNKEINNLNIEYQYAPTVRKGEIINTINQLQLEINETQLEIQSENKNYYTKISNIDVQIKNIQENIKTIETQDTNLLNNVATVNGSISLNWISLWEIADIYLPGPILTWILLLAAFITYLWYRYFVRVSYDYF